MNYFIYRDIDHPNEFLPFKSYQEANYVLNKLRAVILSTNPELWKTKGGDIISMTINLEDLCNAINRFKVFPNVLIQYWCADNNWPILFTDINSWPETITKNEEGTLIYRDGKAIIKYNDGTEYIPELVDIQGFELIEFIEPTKHVEPTEPTEPVEPMENNTTNLNP
jgi:hypothetical protein